MDPRDLITRLFGGGDGRQVMTRESGRFEPPIQKREKQQGFLSRLLSSFQGASEPIVFAKEPALTPTPTPVSVGQTLSANTSPRQEFDFPSVVRQDPGVVNPIELSQPTGVSAEAIRSLFDPIDSATQAAVLANTESGYNYNAISAPNADGSRDYGLFQINENTFRDFARRKPNTMMGLGIDPGGGLQQLLDPFVNAAMARLILEEQGLGAWYAPANRGIFFK